MPAFAGRTRDTHGHLQPPGCRPDADPELSPEPQPKPPPPPSEAAHQSVGHEPAPNHHGRANTADAHRYLVTALHPIPKTNPVNVVVQVVDRHRDNPAGAARDLNPRIDLHHSRPPTNVEFFQLEEKLVSHLLNSERGPPVGRTKQRHVEEMEGIVFIGENQLNRTPRVIDRGL